MLKRIDALLLKSFIPPFFLAFLVALFVLIMQTLWLFVDDIMGKGVGLFLIMELLGYLCISLFPMALPIGILIASVLVFGNISERYELAAMKSSGVSLLRIMQATTIVTLFIAGFSFLCSNYIIPVANLKFKTRLYDIKRQRPTLSIQEKIFNYDFDGYTMRIGKKHEDGQTIEDVMIYDHKQNPNGNLNLVKADRGKMYMTSDGRGFVMNLFNGHQYSEMKATGKSRYPFVKMDFGENEKVFDLTQFEMDRTDEEQHKSHYTMLSVRQLESGIDTLNKKIQRSVDKNLTYILPYQSKNKSTDPRRSKSNTRNTKVGNLPDSTKLLDITIPFVETFDRSDLEILEGKLKQSISRTKPNISREKQTQANLTLLRARHIYELNFKFAIAVICIVFLFIGAPMGAIIRKGGYGYPLLITILFFMLYMVLSISFKETMKVGKMDPFLAAWLPVFILTPIGVLLTVKAMNDSKFLDVDKIRMMLMNLKPIQKPTPS